jgi:alpha/beta hydrolase fold
MLSPLRRTIPLASRQSGRCITSKPLPAAPLHCTRHHSSHEARQLHTHPTRNAHVASASSSSNPALSFPCLDKVESRSASLHQQLDESRSAASPRSTKSSGPEPSYVSGVHETFQSSEPLLLDWGGVLPNYNVAYETWGELNESKSNAILLHTGLSASSHAHSTPSNPQPGWWEKFIGPGGPLDTNKYFVICTNVIGGCYGSTGPSSIDPANGERYATRFPILTMEDMVRAQFTLLDHLGIKKLYASVGSSMGGMQSLAAGVLFPDRVSRVVSISGCARSHPYSIAMRHTQRQGKPASSFFCQSKTYVMNSLDDGSKLESRFLLHVHSPTLWHEARPTDCHHHIPLWS